jgi:hypothetical protein
VGWSEEDGSLRGGLGWGEVDEFEGESFHLLILSLQFCSKMINVCVWGGRAISENSKHLRQKKKSITKYKKTLLNEIKCIFPHNFASEKGKNGSSGSNVPKKR